MSLYRFVAVAALVAAATLTLLLFAGACPALAQDHTPAHDKPGMAGTADQEPHAAVHADAPKPDADMTHNAMSGHDSMAGHEGMAGMNATEGQTPAHVHPTETPVEVGVTERLGDYLPEGIVFMDSTGARVDLRQAIDKPTIIAPVYFNCPTVCNLLQSSLARSLADVSLKPGQEYQVFSVSFDELDTPEIAARKKKQYMAAMHGKYPEQAWRFLVGDLKDIQAFTGAIGFGYRRLGRDFAHPVILVAVSPQGRIVRYLYGNGFMPFDLAMAATEAAEGKVGLSVKRVLSFCFSYDPEGRQYTFNIMRVAGSAVLIGLGIFALALFFGGKKRKRNEHRKS
ncbi:MAG: SCO family protein [Desulfovibrio sp.]